MHTRKQIESAWSRVEAVGEPEDMGIVASAVDSAVRQAPIICPDCGGAGEIHHDVLNGGVADTEIEYCQRCERGKGLVPPPRVIERMMSVVPGLSIVAGEAPARQMIERIYWEVIEAKAEVPGPPSGPPGKGQSQWG